MITAEQYADDVAAAVKAMGPIDPLVDMVRMARHVFVIGNGGSAAIANHVAVDLFKLSKPAHSFCDAATITMIGNDHGFEDVYARLLRVHMKWSDDLLIAISSSGRSPDIVDAAKTVRTYGLGDVVTLSGFHPKNPLREIGHLNFHAPSDRYGVVEMAHHIFLHAATDALLEEMR